MKRTKLMLGVAAISAALLGTGYAAMTDVLTIGGTVNTANFDVNFKDNGELKVGEIVVADEASKTQIQNTYEANGTELTKGEDSITVKVSNLKPGVPVTYTGVMQNASTIDAQLANIVVEDVTQASLNANTDVTITLTTKDDPSKSVAITGKLNALQEAIKAQETAIQELVLQETGATNSELNVVVKLVVDDRVNIEDITEGQTLKYTLKFNWQQTDSGVTEQN